FYIALRELTQLDGGYTVFGQVIDGWDTIDRIVALADRKDIARHGNDANPGTLALIKHARLAASYKAKPPAAGAKPPAAGAKPAAARATPAPASARPPAASDKPAADTSLSKSH